MPLDRDLLTRLYGRHPARVLPFEQLYDGLHAAVRAGNVVVSREGGLEQFTYTTACRFGKQWDLFSLLARGLILDPASRRVVATPFPKFFNFGEMIDSLPNEPFEVLEKIDGSLGIVFHFEGRWIVATKGRLSSEQAIWATRFLNTCAAADRLVPGTTYLVEIVYPQNRIVVPYGFEALFLLGAYDEAGNELPRSELSRVASEVGLRLVPAHVYESFDDLLHDARDLPRDREGFVVRFAGGLRLKLKGEQYCQVHRLITCCTPLALWEAMMNGHDLDVMRGELPEEMVRDFDAIRKLLEAGLAALLAEVRAVVDGAAHLCDREVGLVIQNETAELSPIQRKFLFMARKGRFFEFVHGPGESRRKAFACLRPDRNDLPGYEPSNAINRFLSESA
jgi:RNA ligase